MSSEATSHRYRRGEISPAGDGLLFWRYKGAKEEWRTKEKFDQGFSNCKKCCAKTSQTQKRKEWRKSYFKEYNQRPYKKAYQAAYYKKPEVRAKIRQQWATDPEMRRKAAEYRKTDAAKQSAKQSRLNNPERVKRNLQARNQRIMADPVLRIEKVCRARIGIALKCQGVRKTSRTATMLGCSFEFYRGYLEALFAEGMDWTNYGTRWQVDHKTPIAAFDLSDSDQLKTAFHYTNTQPLWKEENYAKSDMLPGQLFRARNIPRKVIPFTKAA